MYGSLAIVGFVAGTAFFFFFRGDDKDGLQALNVYEGIADDTNAIDRCENTTSK